MEVIATCPLGSVCEEIKDNKIHRCRWYIKIRGTDASGEDVDTEDCSMAWMPILQLEMSKTNRGQTVAIESMRNEQIKRQDAALLAMQQIEKKDGTKLINS